MMGWGLFHNNPAAGAVVGGRGQDLIWGWVNGFTHGILCSVLRLNFFFSLKKMWTEVHPCPPGLPVQIVSQGALL